MMLQEALFTQSIHIPGRPQSDATAKYIVGRNADALEVLSSGQILITLGEHRKLVGAAMFREGAVLAEAPTGKKR